MFYVGPLFLCSGFLYLTYYVPCSYDISACIVGHAYDRTKGHLFTWQQCGIEVAVLSCRRTRSYKRGRGRLQKATGVVNHGVLIGAEALMTINKGECQCLKPCLWGLILISTQFICCFIGTSSFVIREQGIYGGPTTASTSATHNPPHYQSRPCRPMQPSSNILFSIGPQPSRRFWRPHAESANRQSGVGGPNPSGNRPREAATSHTAIQANMANPVSLLGPCIVVSSRCIANNVLR
jgi:hypothetical protein